MSTTGGHPSQRPDPPPLSGPLWRAVYIALTLALLVGASWVGMFYLAAARTEQPFNPRRSQFPELWKSVARGVPLADVVKIMGPPDSRREEIEHIPECADPCAPPCGDFHTCVIEYEWMLTPETESGEVYSVCADAEGIVRRASKGMRFRLNSAMTHGYSLADVVAWAVGAFLLALPVAAIMGRVRRRRRRTESI